MHALAPVHRDLVAFGVTSLAMVLFVEGVKAAAARGLCSSVVARKCMHVGAGPIFVLHWPLFTEGGAQIASLVPLAMTLKFAATGLGILDNKAEVRAMSRTGDPRELLHGPTFYGVTFCAATRLCWRKVHGVTAMMALCFGDGMAEVFGKRYGSSGRGRLPWSRQKSWAGSAGFLVSSVVSSAVFAELFHRWGWSEASLASLMPALTLACLAGCAVESLPIKEIDNLLVPLTVAGVLAWLQRGTAPHSR
jgi:hypothetical protein